MWKKRYFNKPFKTVLQLQYKASQIVLTPLEEWFEVLLELTILAHQPILGTIVSSSQGIYQTLSLSTILCGLRHTPAMISKCQNYALVFLSLLFITVYPGAYI